jgi:predicted transcriptional regulator of viral defense system
MVFEELLALLGREPLFETGFLLAGDVKPGYVRRQLSEWVKAGKLWQLRRGLYAPAPPYQRVVPHPFVIANRLTPGSYVSLQAALAHYDLIPEHVATVTSVTARRPGRWSTPAGVYSYRHLRPSLLFGYDSLPIGEGQTALVATPEKALLDLVYLQPGADVAAYVASLRLQNLDTLDRDRLKTLAERFAKPKLRQAADAIAALVEMEGVLEPL